MANDQALDTLQIDIQASGVSAAEGIQKLADAITNLRKAVGTKTSWAERFAQSIERINTAVSGADPGKMNDTASAIDALAGAMKEAKDASSGMTGVKQALSGLSSQSKAIMETAEAVTGLNGNAPFHGSGLTQRETDIAREFAEESADSNEQASQKATMSWINAFETIKKVVASSVRTTVRLVRSIGDAYLRISKIAGKALVTPLKLAGKAAAELALKFKDLAIKGITLPFRAISGMVGKITNFIRAIGRIALYRAIRSAIKAVTQGLQEGIQNLYQWSLLMDHTFANSMDSIATSMQYLHNGFAAMFSPLIEYAAPILEEITNKVVDFFNIIQQIFATLTGQTTWHKAIRVQKQYEDQVTETGQAAEKAMHQLMAFDELNVITSPSAGGGGGSGSQTPDYGSMFTTEEVDTELTSWVQDIMAFFESGQFYELGSYIGGKLNDLVQQWNAYGDGFKFGEKIRHVLEAFNGFLETFSFYDFGAKVAEWFIGLWDGVDPATVIQFFRNVLTAIRDFVSGFIGRIIKEWEDRTGQSINQFGSWLATTLNQKVQNWNSYLDGFNLGTKIRKVLHQVNEFLANFDFYDLGSKVGDWLAGFVDGITPEEIQDAIVNVINAAVSGASGLIDAINEHNIPAKIGQAIGGAFANFNWDGLANLARKILTGIVAMINSAAQSFISNGGIEKLKDAMAEIGAAIGEAFATADWGSITGIITSIFTGLVSLFSTAISSFVEMGGPAKLKESLATIGTAIGEAFASIRGKDLAAIINSIASGLLEMFKNGITAFSKGQGWKELGDFIQELDWGTLLTVTGLVATLKFGVPIIEGLTKAIVEAAIFNHLKNSVLTAAAGAAAGGTVAGISSTALTLGAAGLVIGLTILAIWRWSEVDIPEWDGDPNRYTGPGGSDLFLNAFSSPLGNVSVLDGMRDELTSSDVPSLATTLGTDLAKSLTEAIKNANIPEFFKTEAKNALKQFLSGDYEGTGLKSASDIKTGFGRGNISEKFREEATVAASAFGSRDFSPEGFNAGDEIKTGLDRSGIVTKFAGIRDNALTTFNTGDYAGAGRNIGNVIGNGMDQANLPGKMFNVGTQMINSLRGAGWEGAFASIGAASGDYFKASFKSHAQATLMLQTAAGAPITQSYIVPYAKGGFPSQGSLFLSGEVAGQTELLGTINGRTGVASGKEITGISDAVYATGNEEATLLRQTNLLLQALLAKDPFGTPNSNAGRWIAQSQQAYKAVTG